MDVKGIRRLAEEMNEVLGLDPALDPDEEDLDLLVEMIKEAGKLVDWENDRFSAKSAALLKSILESEEKKQETSQGEKPTPTKERGPRQRAEIDIFEIIADAFSELGFDCECRKLKAAVVNKLKSLNADIAKTTIDLRTYTSWRLVQVLRKRNMI
jgi:hypothetical protein